MGCLFALFAGIFPRLAVLILWIARPDRVDVAFDTRWGASATQGNRLRGRRGEAA